MEAVPFLYHPTTLALVDDDAVFLQGLVLKLRRQYGCLSFTASHEAKAGILKAGQASQSYEQKYLSRSYEGEVSLAVNIEIAKIHEEIYNACRFAMPIIGIIDYQMPGANGVVLSREIKAVMPFKVILLTGEADQDTAIQAFNNRDIDRFVVKNSPGYEEKLLTYITQLQHDYFIELSRAVLASLNTQESSPLRDDDFRRFFYQLADTAQAVEFYLLDESASFLLLDRTAKNPVWLITRTEEDIQFSLDLMESQGAPSEQRAAVQKRENLLVWHDGDGRMLPVQEWRFVKASQLGDKPIYYCILKDKEGLPLDVAKIQSYAQFLMSNP